MQKTNSFLIKQASLVNEGEIYVADVLVKNGIIEKISEHLADPSAISIEGTGKFLLPGIIDAQVHFREPGFTHKADLYTESKAAIAGGVTSFIDMPNTYPNVLTPEILKEKYKLAAQKSLANFGFFLGVNAQNIDIVLEEDLTNIIGISDDGLYFSENATMLADNLEALEKLFANYKNIIAIHSENKNIITENEIELRKTYGEHLPMKMHPILRSEKACYEATASAIALAVKHHAKLHILHLTTEAETHLFSNKIPLSQKRITCEVSVPHLWFSEKDYDRLGPLIKYNPAIKTEKDKQGLMKALIEDRIDLITTDHSPHLIEEKQQSYFSAMPGAPMIQHSLNMMLEFYQQGKIGLAKIVEKMCHNPALLYTIKNRGFIRTGYYADLVLVDPNARYTVSKENLLYKCGWSPLEGTTFNSKVTHTFVNGNLVYSNGKFDETSKGKSLH